MRGGGRGIPFIGERCSQNAVDAAQHLTFVTFGQHEPRTVQSMIRQCSLPKHLLTSSLGGSEVQTLMTYFSARRDGSGSSWYVHSSGGSVSGSSSVSVIGVLPLARNEVRRLLHD
jgi:hypothetical protein